MAQQIANIEQFKQCLLNAASPVNILRAASEVALRTLETANGELYVTFMLESLAEEEEIIRMLAGLLLKNALKNDTVNHTLYDRIFERYLFVTGESFNQYSRQNLKVLPYILAVLIQNQLKNNIDTIFSQYMNLFDSDRTERVTHAIVAAEELFREHYALVKAHSENSSRLDLVFDRLIHLLKLNDSEYSRHLYPALVTALESADYLSDESMRPLVLQRALELVDTGVAMGYRVLGSCLKQVYEHLEPFMERLISGIGKINSSPNVDENHGYEDRMEMVFFFWGDLCDIERNIRRENEEFLYLEIPPPEQYLQLLQRYGDQVIERLLLLMNSLLGESYMAPQENDSWCGLHTQCIADISRAFNIDISPYLDNITAGRTKLLVSAGSHWTEIFAKIKDDSLSGGLDPIDLRVSPSFLVNALDSEWPELEFTQRTMEVKDTFVQGAAEYLPMYDKSVQDKCIQVAYECVRFPDGKRLGSFAEILRLKLANSSSDFVINTLHRHLLENETDTLMEEDVSCFWTLAQLYPVPESLLEEFITRYLANGANDTDPCAVFYHVIKPLQQVQQCDDIYDKVIAAELEKEDGKYDTALQLLGLMCQKLGETIHPAMYSLIWKMLRALSHHSYNIFETMACITPPAGVSYLSHLETIIDLFELKLHVTDDVQVEYAIRGLITLLHMFKKSSNEFLFVGQIKRIIGALQPAMENEPSIETIRAYLTFIRSLSTIDQASSALRTESVMSVLKHASEKSDGTTRHLALTVKKVLELNGH